MVDDLESRIRARKREALKKNFFEQIELVSRYLGNSQPPYTNDGTFFANYVYITPGFRLHFVHTDFYGDYKRAEAYVNEKQVFSEVRSGKHPQRCEEVECYKPSEWENLLEDLYQKALPLELREKTEKAKADQQKLKERAAKFGLEI
jgi:hypothetical protein